MDLNKTSFSTLLFLLFVSCFVNAAEPDKKFIFEENKGQWDSRIQFKAVLSGVNVYFENKGFTYHFVNKDDLHKLAHHESDDKGKGLLRQHCLKMKFENSNPNVVVTGNHPSAFSSNYFIGSNPEDWHSEVKSYETLFYKNVYPGISSEVVLNENYLKYSFIVEAGASPSQIKLKYSGAKSISLKSQNLIVTTSLGQITELMPVSWQIKNGVKIPVKSMFKLSGSTVSILPVDDYDHSLPLIIDPTLIVSTYTGSAADNWGFTATFDTQGNIYTGGIANSNGYPTSAGAFQALFGGGGAGGNNYPFDIVVTKFNPTGTTLLFSTYLGGSNNESPHSLVVNPNNELVIYGKTYSANFPTTAGAFDQSQNGAADIIISKINSTGTTLLASTFVGGSSDDGVNISASWGVLTSLKQNYGDDARGEIVTDNSGTIYVASCTRSTDFPATAGAYQAISAGGGQDACIFKMNNSLTSMIWSTYLGGSSEDASFAVVLDSTRKVFVTGGTNSVNFPTTAGVLHTSFQGGTADGFIAELDSNGSNLLKSTYLGTPQYDQSYFIQLDNNQDVYVFGQTRGAYPVSAGVYSNPNSSQFIHKLNNALTSTMYSTVFGNGNPIPNISPTAFMVDTCMNVYTSGWAECLGSGTGTTNGMPVTPNAFQAATDGCDFYFFVLRSNAGSLWYASYFGANGIDDHVDGGTSRFDRNGRIYQSVCAGCGGSSAFPTTAGAWSNTNLSGNCNNAVIKYDFDLNNLFAASNPFPNSSGCAPFPVLFTNLSMNAHNYIWDFDDGSPQDTNTTVNHTFVNPGVYDVLLIAIDSLSCNFADTAHLTITVVPDFTVNLGNDTLVCGAPNLLLDPGVAGLSYLWNTSAITQTIVAPATGTYWVQVNNLGCTHRDTIVLGIVHPPYLGNDTAICNGGTLLLDAGSPGAHYLWSTGDTTQTVVVSATGTYSVYVNLSTCNFTDTIKLSVLPAPVVHLGNDTAFCGNTPLILDASNPGANYSWSTGATSQTININSTGNYIVVVTIGQCISADTISINMIPYPVKNLSPDALICHSDSMELDAGNSGSSFLWSNGSTTEKIIVTDAGTYSVKINKQRCITFDTVTVEKLSDPSLGNDSIFCGLVQKQLSIIAPGADIKWSTGETTKTISVNSAGKFWVTVTKGTCEKSDTVYFSESASGDSVFIANILTPNGDGKNDGFEITGLDFRDFELSIFNRWGKLVYETTEKGKLWDGQYTRGHSAPDGVYYWMLKYSPLCSDDPDEKVVRHGFVTLSR